mgnify:CR=1 FL=1
MADDIDDLLDEVEQKFVKKANPTNHASVKSKTISRFRRYGINIFYHR